MIVFKHDTLVIERKPHHLWGYFQHNLDMEIMLRLKPDIEKFLPQVDLPLVIDLQRVNFLDSSAVGVLALFFRHAQEWRLPMVIVHTQPQPESVLSMVGLTDYVPVFGTLPEALAALKIAS